jgi:hypothetical protein
VPEGILEHLAILDLLSNPAFDVQSAMLLLRPSVSAAVNYLERTTHPAKLEPGAKMLDLKMREFISNKLGMLELSGNCT